LVPLLGEGFVVDSSNDGEIAVFAFGDIVCVGFGLLCSRGGFQF